MKATTRDAYNLIHDGTQALARVEANGMRIDVTQLDQTIRETSEEIRGLSDELKQDEVWRLWKRRYGEKATLGSRPQLGEVLFRQMGYKSRHRTLKGKIQVSEEALEGVDLPFVKKYLKAEKLKKLRSTYLHGVRREVVDGYLHPSFNLHLVKTYRSSSDSPNFQNIPIRDKVIGKLIRSCFVPREGHVLVEIDYGALEFRICACHWRDRAMIEYASDPALDIHRDMAAECYCINPELDGDVPKMVRFHAKGGFVFATLYGSYYRNTCQHLWNVIAQDGLTTHDGVDLRRHLKDNGIVELGKRSSTEKPERGTFERHIQQVERRFHKRFPEWSKRKDQWWDRYQQRGWFDMMTGFRCAGVFSRNFLYNCPIQGPAFHCLLWSLVQLVKWTEKNRMKTKIIGQIHDSIEADVHVSELDDYLAKAKQVMTEDIRRAWPWIVTPLEVEVEIGERNWFEKKEVEV